MDEHVAGFNEHWAMIVSVMKENIDTDCTALLSEHLKIIREYSAKVKEGKRGRQAFSDSEAYEMFVASSLFYIKLDFLVFQKKDLVIENDFGFYEPFPEDFHYSDDEKFMHKNRTIELISEGDVLNLRIVEKEINEFKLQIINMYGNNRRILEDEIFAVLPTGSDFVTHIKPPFRKSEYVRAVFCGTCKQEEGHFKKMLVSLNPKKVKDEKLKSLPLGRIRKRDIAFFPKDITGCNSFGQYIADKISTESAQTCLKHISAMHCDPKKTGPFYHSQINKYKDLELCDSEIHQKLNILYDKSKIAKDNLNKGDLEKALFEIEEGLALLENDAALTLRGKIYLAMAGGKPSSKIGKAMLDFETALKINADNKEAAAFHDLIIMQSVNRFTQNNMMQKAEELRFHLKRPNQVNEEAVAFMEDIKNGKYTKKTPNTEADTLPSIETVTLDNAVENIVADISTLGEQPMELD